MNRKRTRVIANIVVGKADVKPSAPSHVRGVFQGNKPHLAQRHKGIEMEEADRAEGSARRSTGIRPKDHGVIDPRMPKISPA
jgi:hypothetical protein